MNSIINHCTTRPHPEVKFSLVTLDFYSLIFLVVTKIDRRLTLEEVLSAVDDDDISFVWGGGVVRWWPTSGSDSWMIESLSEVWRWLLEMEVVTEIGTGSNYPPPHTHTHSLTHGCMFCPDKRILELLFFVTIRLMSLQTHLWTYTSVACRWLSCHLASQSSRPGL